tara:strand:- start:165 stop:998 length:834 start_codon:yes stop_codon:yes gene_type:complete
VKEQQDQVLRLFTPLYSRFQKFALVFFILLSLTLVPISLFDSKTTSNVRILLIDAVSPILNVMSRPVFHAKSLVNEINQLLSLRSEVEKLRHQNKKLLAWQAVGRKLEIENNELRQLLTVTEETPPSFLTARVIADSNGLFVRTIILNAGKRDGVKNGYAVANSEGLVGRIVEVGERSSRVLQIVDLNSRIPIMISPSGQKAILSGDNSDTLNLLFLSSKQNLSVGNYIVTSGDGGLFPSGVGVGYISSLNEGSVKVRPFVKWRQVNYVKVLMNKID